MALWDFAKNRPVLSSALIGLSAWSLLKAVQKLPRKKVLLAGEKDDDGTRSSLRKGFEVDPITSLMVGLGPRAISLKEGVSVLRLFYTESKQRSRFELWFIAPGCSVNWGELHPEPGAHHDHEMILRCLQGDLGLGIGEEELQHFSARDLCFIPNLLKTQSKGGIVFQNSCSDKPAVVLSIFGPCMPTGFAQVRTPAGFVAGRSHARKNWIEAVQRVVASKRKANEWPSLLQVRLLVLWHSLGHDAHSLEGKVPPRMDETCVFSNTGKEPFIFTEDLHQGTGEMCRGSFFNQASRQASTVQLWNISVGGSEGMHVHQGSGNDMPSVGNLEEIYLCVGGKGAITLKDGSDLELSVGDAAYVPACVWHGVENRGDSNFFLMVFWGNEEQAGQQYRAGKNVRLYGAARLKL